MALVCELCGARGAHMTHECPYRAELGPRRPEDRPVPVRPPDSQIADAKAWAERVRRDLGWSRERAAERKRALALEQVAVSRAMRGADLDVYFAGAQPGSFQDGPQA